LSPKTHNCNFDQYFVNAALAAKTNLIYADYFCRKAHHHRIIVVNSSVSAHPGMVLNTFFYSTLVGPLS
jgi:hypothetical protein